MKGGIRYKKDPGHNFRGHYGKYNVVCAIFLELLSYLKVVLEVLINYQFVLKLKRTQFLGLSQDLCGS